MTLLHSIRIGDRQIGPGEPVFVVAELSANHCGCFDTALQLIRAAKEAGADAVKLQTYTPDTMTIDSTLSCFVRGSESLWAGRTLYDLYREAQTPWSWHAELKKAAEELGLVLFSTPFDRSAVDFLEQLNMPAYKVASFEMVDLSLIEAIAQTGKPIVLSTGMASVGEIEEAVRTAQLAGATQLALLKCTSAYPAPADSMNLRTIPHMAELFKVPVGLSDHTQGIAVAVASVALGACIVEKHFTLTRANGSLDAPFSLEPEEFLAMVEAIRTAEKALGRVRYESRSDDSLDSCVWNERQGASRENQAHSASAPSRPCRDEANVAKQRQTMRRSLFVVENIAKGEPLTEANVRSIRPGNGLLPKYLPTVLGRCASRSLERGTPLSWDCLE